MKFPKFLIFLGFLGNPSTGIDLNQLADLLPPLDPIDEDYRNCTSGENQDCVRKVCNFWKKNIFWKICIEICFKNRKFRQNSTIDQKSKCWSKTQILVKNGHFGQKRWYWPKIEILVKYPNYGQISKFERKPQMLTKNPNGGDKSKYLFTNPILVSKM